MYIDASIFQPVPPALMMAIFAQISFIALKDCVWTWCTGNPYSSEELDTTSCFSQMFINVQIYRLVINIRVRVDDPINLVRYENGSGRAENSSQRWKSPE